MAIRCEVLQVGFERLSHHKSFIVASMVYSLMVMILVNQASPVASDAYGCRAWCLRAHRLVNEPKNGPQSH